MHEDIHFREKMSNSNGDSYGFQDQIIGHKFNELSLNSGEFLSFGEALNMFSADEKQNMMDNQFNEEMPSDRFDKSTLSLPEGWKMASLCSVTTSSLQSGSGNNNSREEEKVKRKKISFGSYIALRSFPLGCLEGSEAKDIERPSFGDFQKPDTNYRNSADNRNKDNVLNNRREKSPSEAETQTNETLLNEVNLDYVQDSEVYKHAAFGSKGIWNSRSSKISDSREGSYVGRQLSAIAELSRESEQYSGAGSLVRHDVSVCPTSHLAERGLDEKQNVIINYKTNSSNLKDNMMPMLSRHENCMSASTDFSNPGDGIQTAEKQGSRKTSDYVADWLEAATNHHIPDINNNSPSKNKALGKFSIGKSSGSSNQCYSSTPIKSAARRMSSPVSDIEPCHGERIRLSSISTCVFDSPGKSEKIINWDSETATICNSSSKMPNDGFLNLGSSSCLIEMRSELAFKDVCCVGSSSEEVLKLDNHSNLLCSINLSLHSLFINGERVSSLDDHKHVFSFEKKIFLNKLSSNHVKVYFEPGKQGCFVAQLMLNVVILDTKRHETQEKKNIEARRHVVTLQAIAEQPVIEITTPGITSACRQIDFGEIPGDCHDVRRILITNKCKASVPININMASHINGAKDCYKFLFHLSKVLKTKVMHNQFSDCLLNMMLPAGSQIEMDVGFSGPHSTIGIKRVSCKIEILLASLKQTLLSFVDIHALTAVPRIGISLKSLILTFDKSMHEHKAKLSNKGPICLHLETESDSNLFTVQPKSMKLEPFQSCNLVVSYNYRPMREENGNECKVESQIKFWIKPNGKPHVIRVLARTGTKAASVTSLSSYLPVNNSILADQWQVTLKKCTFVVDVNESVTTLQNKAKTFCIINNSDLDLSFKILIPETLSVTPSFCVIQARSSKGFQLSPSSVVYSKVKENVCFPELGVVSISCHDVVRHILVSIKTTSSKISLDKTESAHPLINLICPPEQNSCTFKSQGDNWELFFKDCSFKTQSATIVLASKFSKDIFWNLKPCSKQVISSSFKRAPPEDVFSFDSYQGMLHPGSTTELKVFLKIPFSASFYQVWIFDVNAEDRYKPSYLKLKAEVQIPIPCAKQQALEPKVVEPTISEALTSFTDDSNSQGVKPHKFIDNAAIRLTSQDKKLQVIPEYLNFDSSVAGIEVIEKIEFKNTSNSDLEMKVIKLPQLPFVMEHKEFVVKGMCRLKIPVKYISSAAGGAHQSEVMFLSANGDSFKVYLIFKSSS